MNKIVPLLAFSVIIAPSIGDKRQVNGQTVLVNNYMYPIPVHNTPLRIKKTPALEDEKVPIPHKVYGIPNEDPVIVGELAASEHEDVLTRELPTEPVLSRYKYKIPAAPEIMIINEAAPGKPALEYGVPDVAVLKSKPAPGEPALVYGVPKMITRKSQAAPVKPALVYGVPEEILRSKPAFGEPVLVYGVPKLVAAEVN